jgi:hypothetical protein
MRIDDRADNIRVGSLRELDALVGERLTHETPDSHWEDARTQIRFHTLEDAIDAVSDPYVSRLKPHGDTATTVLTEIREYRRYSSDLGAAWLVVEQISADARALVMQRHGEHWAAAFGTGPVVEAPTAPLAICVAGLLAQGIQVEFDRAASCEAVRIAVE